jgi:nucleotide-binding universal stress UspA family protein
MTDLDPTTAPATDTGTDVPPNAVLAGVNSSPHALAAARWAAVEATSRRAELVLIHAAPHLDAHPAAAESRRAHAVLTRARTAAQEYLPRDRVHTLLLAEDPAEALIRLSAHSPLLVLGLTGDGGLDEVLLGSTSLTVSGRARCPLVGVRDWPVRARGSGANQVVVGVSSVRADVDALDVAFDLAHRRACDLLVVHSTRHAPDAISFGEYGARRETNRLAWQLRGWRHRYRTVDVSYQVCTGAPSAELLRHAHQAEAIVVGSRKRGPAARALLGSTSRTVLRYSSVPTVVIGPQASVSATPCSPGGAGGLPHQAADPHALSNLW